MKRQSTYLIQTRSSKKAKEIDLSERNILSIFSEEIKALVWGYLDIYEFLTLTSISKSFRKEINNRFLKPFPRFDKLFTTPESWNDFKLLPVPVNTIDLTVKIPFVTGIKITSILNPLLLNDNVNKTCKNLVIEFANENYLHEFDRQQISKNFMPNLEKLSITTTLENPIMILNAFTNRPALNEIEIESSFRNRIAENQTFENLNQLSNVTKLSCGLYLFYDMYNTYREGLQNIFPKLETLELKENIKNEANYSEEIKKFPVINLENTESPLPKVKNLEIKSIKSEGFRSIHQHLLNLFVRPVLESLILTNCCSKLGINIPLIKEGEETKLNTLILDNCCINNIDQILYSSVKLKKFKFLDNFTFRYYNYETDDSIINRITLALPEFLESLDISFSKKNVSEAYSLHDLSRLTKLKELTLNYPSSVTMYNIHCIVSLERLTLTLNYNKKDKIKKYKSTIKPWIVGPLIFQNLKLFEMVIVCCYFKNSNFGDSEDEKVQVQSDIEEIKMLFEKAMIHRAAKLGEIGLEITEVKIRKLKRKYYY